MKQIISRRDARRAGLSYYFTGEPCKHGHTAERQVWGQHCIECDDEAKRIRNQKYCEQISARIDNGRALCETSGNLLDLDVALEIFKAHHNAFEFVDSLDG